MERSSRPTTPSPSVGDPPATIDHSLDGFTPGVAPWRLRLDRALTPHLFRGFGYVATRWPLGVALASSVLVLVAYLSPLLKHLGYSGAGQAIFAAYYYICAQTPSHSYYPWGHQAALDQRMTAIYTALAVAAVVYHARFPDARPLGWRLYLLLILPMALDGFTQAFGWRESTWELRTLTGVLFAVASVWTLFPRLRDLLDEDL